MAQRSGRSAALVVLGVCALVLGGWFGYVTWRDTGGRSSEPAAAAAPSVPTERVVSRAGGYSVAVPTDMTVRKHGRTVRLSSRDQDLVISVGPGEKGTLLRANRRLLSDLSSTYRAFEPLASERLQVGGRPALSAAGTLTNKAGVRLRFVAVTVRAAPRNYALVAFAARDSDPASILPRVNAVASGFEVLRR
jgi:hypothetical protein